MTPRKPGFETKDTSFAGLVTATIALLVIVAATLLVTRVLDRILKGDHAGKATSVSTPLASDPQPPEPRLQVDPATDLVRMHDVENVALNNYAWVDPNAGSVRIPITRAMAILAEQGLPARSTRKGASE